ncbi:hypothetical protein [Secundilactobacillus similis]|uniref:Lipoprotein n=1 Tax=Secundilactobacillus similis DSM 23365 = JCM 2765 TaxID=1423804 RepID=A0A0R2EGU9_9LACO|nr:hypothetical protein [Secundilactobacillus similis]KRN15502.1 hypothetical protein FD14_GL002841 [Secundilactobacillus similis DSM 23365 = JCM 2765]
MHIKQVVKWGLPLLMLGVLGGCGQNKQSQSQSESTASSKQVKQSDQSSSDSATSASTSSESDAATSASDATSTTQSNASTAATSSSQSADSTQKNTTKSSSANTTGTVSQASVLNQVYQQLSGQYARQDLLMQVSQGQPGIYTVQVQENHQSANMKSAGADPSTTPTVAWFQTNQQGQLLRSDNGGASYYVVGKVTQ